MDSLSGGEQQIIFYELVAELRYVLTIGKAREVFQSAEMREVFTKK
ncbi:MAG: hypothetical protein SR3Q1_08865 [Quinella sp. 3Q1]|nr:hypothetical protein [Quinella sp. 3Q1]MBR6887921.1 hypothetical protein [Selenomonadaceae bacterium]